MRASFPAIVGIAIGMAGWSPTGVAQTKSRSRPPGPANAPASAASGEPSKAPASAAAASGVKNGTAIFAGGCFWCMEIAFEQLAGVVDVESGYCGGPARTANYAAVHRGSSGHAEAIRVTYDPDKISYDDLLDVFFDSHDPTQLNRQGQDVGRQYRSAIFFASEEQQKQAEAKIADLEAKHVFKRRRIVTKIEPLERFYRAEDYHQDFAQRNPLLPYVRSHALPKAARVQTKHPDLIRKNDSISRGQD